MRLRKLVWALSSFTLAAGCGNVLGIREIPTQEEGGALMGASPDGSPGHDAGSGDDGTLPSMDAEPAADAPETDSGEESETSSPLDSAAADAGNAETGSTCGGTCVTPAPAGWTGPFQLYTGATAGAPTVCPSAAPSMVFSAKQNNDTPALECSTCTCSAGPAHCKLGFLVSSSPSCAASSCNVPEQAFSNTCGSATDSCATPVSTEWIAYEAENSNALPEAPTAFWTVTASAQTPTTPPVAWATAGVGCADSAAMTAGCSGGSLCVPTPATPFQSPLCISQTGNVACTSTAYPTKTVYYSGATDGRVCSPCACTPSGTVTCSGTLTFYTDTGCVTEIENVPNLSSSCLTGADFQSWNLASVTTIGTPGGTAQSGSGVASGTVMPTGPITVCCQP